jgi:hypothetical protein
MISEQKCPKCGIVMKKIPIKKINSMLMIEFYCELCDESITYFPEIDKIKFEKLSFF